MSLNSPENCTFIQRVRSAARQDVISHATILSGTGDLTDAARYLAAAQLCRSSDKPCLTCNVCRKVLKDIHPDVITVQAAGHRELAVDAMRELKQDVYIRPHEGERKIYLFADCSQLNERDQNVLLKIIEDGPSYASFLFCTESTHSLLPTVRSRCTAMHLCGDEVDEIGQDAIALCSAIGARDPDGLMHLLTSLENRKLKREDLQAMLSSAWALCAEDLLQRSGKAGSAECLRQTAPLRSLSDRQLQRLTDLLEHYAKECSYTVGVGHILGALLCDLSNQEVIP